MDMYKLNSYYDILGEEKGEINYNKKPHDLH